MQREVRGAGAVPAVTAHCSRVAVGEAKKPTRSGGAKRRNTNRSQARDAGVGTRSSDRGVGTRPAGCRCRVEVVGSGRRDEASGATISLLANVSFRWPRPYTRTFSFRWPRPYTRTFSFRWPRPDTRTFSFRWPRPDTRTFSFRWQVRDVGVGSRPSGRWCRVEAVGSGRRDEASGTTISLLANVSFRWPRPYTRAFSFRWPRPYTRVFSPIMACPGPGAVAGRGMPVSGRGRRIGA